MKDFEKKFGMSTDMFLAKFKTGEISEDGETFERWSEKKIVDELMEKSRAITSNGVHLIYYQMVLIMERF